MEAKTGFEVCGEAASGLDAIQQAKELRPDIVVLDLRMPDMNGLQTAPVIKRALPSVVILLFTINRLNFVHKQRNQVPINCC